MSQRLINMTDTRNRSSIGLQFKEETQVKSSQVAFTVISTMRQRSSETLVLHMIYNGQTGLLKVQCTKQLKN